MTLLLFLMAALALNITPGPDMLYVLTRGASLGRRAGVVSALGIATGSLIQTGIVALGLAGLLQAVPLLFTILKIAGALYLAYLGIRMLLSRQSALTAHRELPNTSLWRVYSQGIITNVLNPKVALFYIAFLPQFIDPAWGHVPMQLFLLGTLFNISGTLVNTLVAVLAGLIGIWLKRNEKSARFLNWLTGGIFIGLGVRLALTKQH
ncbi:LysE family translocator [Dictyobacter arantiisoli]|uniref:Lysine transporter LysE n=1 Tax=Dictyobacter arantiisoli TaxID=2014874 RepID=A0A5A5TG26_9CHLR|nr:LysE family translocator [Dictyobacter arantiisoli]GCF10530.1 lysine transporter LysE [Dictyobacter arantiisoli]